MQGILGDEPEGFPPPGGVYSAEMLKCSKASVLHSFDLDDDELSRSRLRLPPDGSIFNNNIPFHHVVLTQLKEKHIRRLKQNGLYLVVYKYIMVTG